MEFQNLILSSHSEILFWKNKTQIFSFESTWTKINLITIYSLNLLNFININFKF